MTSSVYTKHLKLLFIAVAMTLILSLSFISPNDLFAKSKQGAGQKKSAKNKKNQAQTNKPANNLTWPQNLLSLVGDGAVLVIDNHAPEGSPKELYAYNAERNYVPASILKIVTSGAALEFLGPGFRFKTDFLYTKNKDLWIIGYGDPYLVSEELAIIAESLQIRGLKEVRHIYVDGSYFESDIILDGNTQTARAYDAYNTAFGVNFNTISFRKNKNGQTLRISKYVPVTPMALEEAAKYKNAGPYTLNIYESPALAEQHAGQTFKVHLEEAGIKVTGEIKTGQAAPKKRKVFYCHESSRTLQDSIRALMEHSNNFMTNQIFLAMGAELYGAPASLEKSQMAMNAYFAKHGLSPITMGDGSGLSRQTTLTARQMAGVLEVLEPDRYLFSNCADGQVLCKTGTMSDIKTLAGYMERPGNPDRPISFVILLNGPAYQSATRYRVLDLLKAEFLPAPSGGS